MKQALKKVMATLLTVIMFCVIGGANVLSAQSDETEFSLIGYLETHEIDTYDEFMNVIRTFCPEYADPNDEPNNISYFHIDIDYDNMIVAVITMGEASHDRSHGASNSASKSYYTDIGIKKFTITVEGTFSYVTGSCSTVSCSGNYSKPFYSTWTSTPTISSGNINARKAYARISGTATSGSDSTSYSLTLTCDDSGNFTSY